MRVSVKTYRRGKSIVKAHSRSVILRSQRLTRVQNRVAKSLLRAKASGNLKVVKQRFALSDRLTPMFVENSKHYTMKRHLGRLVLKRKY